MAIVEIYRRAQWLIFRTENEYFQNIKLRRKILETEGKPWPQLRRATGPGSLDEVSNATFSLRESQVASLMQTLNEEKLVSGTDTESGSSLFLSINTSSM